MSRVNDRLVMVGALVVPLVAGAANADSATPEQRGRQLVEQVVKAVGGGLAALHARAGVEYEYTYRLPSGQVDVSVERYLFAGELSWARYLKRDGVVLPQLKGKMVQGYDGERSWMMLDGKPVTDLKLLKMADFLRKTNYYWFAMMHKLLDPGTQHRLIGQRATRGVTYEVVELTFGKGVGDVQDRYMLYVNPKTKLVDQFLFTVLDFGKAKPYLMHVEYETIDGLKLPVTRRYTESDWTGKVTAKAKWRDELMRKVRFTKALQREAFKATGSL